MTARPHRAIRRAVLAAYTAASALLVWTVAAADPLVAVLVAVLLAAVAVAGVRAARPRRIPDAELLAVAAAVDVVERPGRHACDTPTTVMPQVKP